MNRAAGGGVKLEPIHLLALSPLCCWSLLGSSSLFLDWLLCLPNISPVICVRVQILHWLQFWCQSQALPRSWPQHSPDKMIFSGSFLLVRMPAADIAEVRLSNVLLVRGVLQCFSVLMRAAADQLVQYR